MKTSLGVKRFCLFAVFFSFVLFAHRSVPPTKSCLARRPMKSTSRGFSMPGRTSHWMIQGKESSPLLKATRTPTFNWDPCALTERPYLYEDFCAAPTMLRPRPSRLAVSTPQNHRCYPLMSQYLKSHICAGPEVTPGRPSYYSTSATCRIQRPDGSS